MFSDTDVRNAVRQDVFWVTFSLAVADFIRFTHLKTHEA